MKSKIKPFLAILTFIIGCHSTSFSQKELVVDSPEYHKAKMDGTLEQYTVVRNLDLGLEVKTGRAKPSTKPNPNKPKSGDCDCYVEPDGSYTLAMSPNDDGSSALISLPFSFNFYGTNYNSLYINNNGNITFGASLMSYSSTAFPSNSNRIVAPFWADVDTRNGNGQVVYKITPTAIYVNWEGVGYFSQQGDKLNTFQLILSDGTDPAIPDGNNVAFCYQDMQWTTGSASNGVNGFGGTPATCGANKGDNIGYFLIARFDHAGNDFDGALGNNDGISWLDNKSFFFNITNSSNTPPIAQGISACDTIRICNFDDTADVLVNFLSPELNQSTSITFNNGGMAEATIVSNTPGNTASIVFRLIGNAGNVGTYTMTLTATDNYTPTPGVTTISFVVVVENPGSAMNPIIDYTTACDSFPVTVLNGPYDTYLWDDQTVYPSTMVTESGVYGITVSLDNCFKRVEEYIYVPEPVNFALQGNLYLCPGEDSTYLTIGDSMAIDMMDWNTGSPNDGEFSMWLTPGTYTIYNQDSTGHCNNDTTFTIAQGVPSTIFANAVSCDDLTYQVSGATMGTSATWSSPDSEISFSSTTIANPIITASTYGTYTINLSTPCNNDLETEIMFVNKPTIFADDTICGDTYNVDSNTVHSFDGGIWSSVSPSIVSFSNDTIPNPVITTNTVPFNAQLIYTDKYCPNLSDYATILFVQSGMPSIPSQACNLGSYDLTVDNYNGGIWSIIDNPSTTWLEDTAATFVYGNTAEQPGLIVSTPGVYTVHYEDAFCNISMNGDINFLPYVYTEIGDTMLCMGVEYELMAWQPPYDDISYMWNTGATTTSIMVTEPGQYSVTVSNACHSYTDTADIGYYVCDIEAPNVISLSSTAGNNLWSVDAAGVKDYECFIVNRWGNVVYEMSNVTDTWDGRDRSGNPVAEGVYFYTIRATMYGGNEVTKEGFIHVVH